jgi:hypothetical protein
VADLPVSLDPPLAQQLERALDVEGKIPRALEALGPVAGCDVLVIDGATGLRARQLEELGARVRHAESLAETASWPPESVDVVTGWWSSFRGVDATETALVDRVLRDGGRLLVVHDYGRDDVSRLRGADRPEYGEWSRREGPFLTGGFRVRVLHCWWTFDSIDAATSFLEAAFGEAGREVAAGLKRPRLSYNVAVYHRTKGEHGTA